MDAALVLSLLRHWRGIVEGAERADVCVDMMRREEQNASGEEEKGIKKKEILLSTKRSGVAILTSQMIKKALITQKLCRISAYVGMCILNNAPSPPRLYSTRCCTVYTVGEQGGRGGGGCRESTRVCRLLRMWVCERAVQQLNIRTRTNTERCT